MGLENVIALTTLASLILYALLAGADFGAGVWDLFASKSRAAKQRQLIAQAIGPIWEANHVWLILVIVLLFTAWPRAFGVIMTALHVPLTIMLVGIVLRGAAFVFRSYDSRRDTIQRRWSRVFGISSLFTPILQGMVLGGLTSGAVRVEGARVTTGFFAGWLSPFAISCGIFALALFAFLAATYLTVDAEGEPEVQNDFRRKALTSGILLLPIAVAVFVTSKKGAPEMYGGLTNWWAPPLLVWTSASAILALMALWLREFRLARIGAVLQVSSILAGWCIAQYPNLVYPDVTIYNAAAPEVTLRLLVIALALGAVILLPSLYYLFTVFKKFGQPDETAAKAVPGSPNSGSS